MSAISDEILARVRADLAVRQARVTLDDLKLRALARPSALDAVSALRGEGVAVIAEVDPACVDRGALADAYERGGARVVSVPIRQDEPGGDLGELAGIRTRVQIPVLHTALIVSSYQLWEARAYGADLVLLSAAALEQEALVSLVERAGSIGLTAMVEVRDRRELVRAMRAGAGVIAVAPRERGMQDVDRAALADLLSLIPDRVVRVAECAAGRTDLIACARLGADAVRVGATLLASAGEPRAAVAALVAVGAHPALARGRHQAV